MCPGSARWRISLSAVLAVHELELQLLPARMRQARTMAKLGDNMAACSCYFPGHDGSSAEQVSQTQPVVQESGREQKPTPVSPPLKPPQASNPVGRGGGCTGTCRLALTPPCLFRG